MWPFRRNKDKEIQQPGFTPTCPYCGSTDTRARSYSKVDQPDYIRVWRGQRYITCKCSDCGRNFYFKEPPHGITEEAILGDRIVEDGDELRSAEEEVRRKTEKEDRERR
jgi:hypothetical protein